jgi:hypothetical protein
MLLVYMGVVFLAVGFLAGILTLNLPVRRIHGIEKSTAYGCGYYLAILDVSMGVSLMAGWWLFRR